MRCSVVWLGVAWCGLVWLGVVLCGVAFCCLCFLFCANTHTTSNTELPVCILCNFNF